MSGPRMIPAYEAKALREAQEQKVKLPWSNALVGDLAHTVVEQDAQIADLAQEVNDHHYDLTRVTEERNQLAAQIRRVCGLLDQAAKDEGHQADSLSSEYHKGKHDAYATAAKFIRGAFGDTDE